MEAQWWIDTVGKLGSATVALIVLVVTVTQNGWNSEVARRSAAIEDQKVRLALLDRRLQVFAAFDAFQEEWRILEMMDADTLGRFERAIDTAELVFPGGVEQLRHCQRCRGAYSRSRRQLIRAQNGDDHEALAHAQNDIAQRDVELDAALTQARQVLIDLARVDAVAPLPPTFRQKVARIFRRTDT